jgi:hypothetical protein
MFDRLEWCALCGGKTTQFRNLRALKHGVGDVLNLNLLIGKVGKVIENKLSLVNGKS